MQSHSSLTSDKSIWPKPGEVWQHYKGSYYTIISMAQMENTGQNVVVYRSQLQREHTWVRPVAEFMLKFKKSEEANG